MSMIKVIQPNSQDFSEPVAQLIKISSRGLLGADKDAFVKRAGVDFAERLSRVKFAADEIPVHMIAIGSTEDYGPNRNADGFTRDTCRKYHNTFEKFAKFYRDHANKNPAISYGVVKLAAYNEPMHRIELICALNASKEAADRNGGLLADKEMEKLARGDDIGVSMACKIPFDVCSGCGNKARTRAEYCDATEHGGMCKAGGLKHNLGRVLDNGHILHADNPNPTFFDISHVFRPADRIAYISGQLKAASAGVISGAALAEELGVTAPAAMNAANYAANVSLQLEALEKLAAAELNIAAQPALWSQVALSSAPGVQPAVEYGPVDNIKLAEVLCALADAGAVLPVREFLALTVKNANAALVREVVAGLDGVYTSLSSDPDIVAILEKNAYYPASSAAPKTRVWAEKVAMTHSILPHVVEKRAYQAAVRNARPVEFVREKKASSGAVTDLARQYALYKLAAYASLSKKYGICWLTANHCVLQNYVT
jgi:hypothetical protein